MAHTLPSEMLTSCDGLFICIADWANDVTNGIFWTGLLLAFCIALFMATQRYGTPRSFGFSAIVGLLGATMLATMQLMPWWIASIFILTGATGIAVLILNER